MLSSIFTKANMPSAAWLSSGVYVDGNVQDGELGPWSRVVLAARHGEIDVALHEMNAATVVGAGLPEDTYPIVILTTLCGNNESCLLNAETELERRALEIVVRSARSDGTIVANADDYDIVELALSSPARPILYALHRENPALQRHLTGGGLGGWVEDGWVVVGGAHEATPIVEVGAVPATLDGTILFQIQNILAAVCTAYVVGMPSDAIGESLAAFSPQPDVQPAACNIVRFNDATILIDAPRQISSLRLLARGIRHTPHRRTLVVSGSFPGLRDEDAHEAGRILGGLGGVVLLHAEHASPERMETIKAGIASAHVPPIVMLVPGETRAIDHLLNTIAPDDVALVIADDAEVVLEHLWPAPVISVEASRKNGLVSKP